VQAVKVRVLSWAPFWPLPTSEFVRKCALISGRTKSALAAGKAEGVKLGNPKLNEARGHVAALKAEADRAAGNVLPIIAEIQRSGATTLRAIAEALNARGVPTPRGGRWHAMTVRNVLTRA
jgi:DNA invertase Pin-like site-specific DNA recombinase